MPSALDVLAAATSFALEMPSFVGPPVGAAASLLRGFALPLDGTEDAPADDAPANDAPGKEYDVDEDVFAGDEDTQPDPEVSFVL